MRRTTFIHVSVQSLEVWMVFLHISSVLCQTFKRTHIRHLHKGCLQIGLYPGAGSRGMGSLRALLEWTPVQAHATAHKVTLIYASASPASAAFLKDWDSWREAGVCFCLPSHLLPSHEPRAVCLPADFLRFDKDLPQGEFTSWEGSFHECSQEATSGLPYDLTM